MQSPPPIEVDGYRLAADRYYDQETHLWVGPETAGVVCCGFDPLGSESVGDIVAISFAPVGARVERGDAFGSLEAAKFVGPLVAPVSGTVRAHNETVLARPGLVNEDPLAHWLVELAPECLADDLELLLRDRELVRAWFELEVQRYHDQGMIAQ